MKKDDKDSSEQPADSGKESKARSDEEPKDSKNESNDLEKGSKDLKKEASGSEKDSKGEEKDIKKEPSGSRQPNKDLKLSEKDSEKKPVHDIQDSLEDALSHIGEMGRYQKILFLFMVPFGVFFAFLYFVQMFIAVTPQRHWCAVPELSHLDLELRRNLSAPGAATGTGKWDRCSTYKVNWSDVRETLTPPPPGTPTEPCRHGWDFEFTDIPYSNIVNERGWVCEYSSNLPMSQAVFFVGAFIGGLLLGWLADYCGRLPALMCANLIGGIGGIATIFTTGFWDYMLCRFVAGLAFDNCFMMPYILVLEYVGPSYRTWVANLAIVFYGAGCMVLPGLALWFKDWKLLLWVTSLPMLIVVFAPLGYPESARWYMSRGRVNQAVLILKKFARVNGTTIPDEVLNELVITANEMTKNQTDESLIVLLKSVPLRLTMIFMLIVYMATSVIYDVLVRLSDAFGLDFFITFAVTSATEIPSVVLLASLLDIWGRRYLTAAPIALSGICIFTCMVVPKGIPQASMAVLARFCINMSYNAVVLWTAELLPTAVRASGSAAMHMTGYVAAILSPYIVYSERLWHHLPLLTLVIVSVFSSVITTALPETKGQLMPQTIADGERMAQEQSGWNFSFKKSDKVEWKSGKEKPVKIV